MFKPCFHVHHVWKQKFGFFILLGPSCGTLHLTYYSLIKYFKLCWAVVTLLCYCVKVLQCGDPERSNVVKLNKTQWKQEKTKSQCFWWENNAEGKRATRLGAIVMLLTNVTAILLSDSFLMFTEGANARVLNWGVERFIFQMGFHASPQKSTSIILTLNGAWISSWCLF